MSEQHIISSQLKNVLLDRDEYTTIIFINYYHNMMCMCVCPYF